MWLIGYATVPTVLYLCSVEPHQHFTKIQYLLYIRREVLLVFIVLYYNHDQGSIYYDNTVSLSLALEMQEVLYSAEYLGSTTIVCLQWCSRRSHRRREFCIFRFEQSGTVHVLYSITLSIVYNTATNSSTVYFYYLLPLVKSAEYWMIEQITY